MIKKESIVLGISAVIIVIAGVLTLQSQGSADQTKKKIVELNAIIQDKDAQIAKLTADVKEVQDEIVSVKTELETAKEALADIAAKANTAVQKPAEDAQSPVAQQPVLEAPQPVTQ